MFKERIKEKVYGVINQEHKVAKPEKFNAYIRDLFDEIVDISEKHGADGTEGAKREVEKRFSDSAGRFGKIASEYRKMWNVYQAVLDIRNSETESDVEEKIRLFIFRIATAIGIAIVVVAASWVAQELGITIPLLRVV